MKSAYKWNDPWAADAGWNKFINIWAILRIARHEQCNGRAHPCPNISRVTGRPAVLSCRPNEFLRIFDSCTCWECRSGVGDLFSRCVQIDALGSDVLHSLTDTNELTRCRLTASPATGLVGMEENSLLSDYFSCMGFISPTSERYSCLLCSTDCSLLVSYFTSLT